MFSQITSYPNIEAAYLEIIEQFAADRRNFKYHGIDNIFLRDIDLKSKTIIKIVQADLLCKKEIEPALSVKITKRNKPNEYREIFIYNLKERIKAQAIYRVVLPEFEKKFSHRLFSYRPNKPPYLAARIFCRRYRQNFLTDQALVLDLKNYSDRIDRNLMFAKLQDVFTDKDLLETFRLFIFNKIYRDGICELPEKGLIQGVPLIALFANLYLTDIDFKYQKKSNFYIRVGDDIAFLDPDKEKLKEISTEILDDINSLKLELNQQKLFFGAASEAFSYLGYSFNNGLISLEPAFINRIELEWKKILVYQHLSDKYKLKFFEKIMDQPKNNFNYQFQKIIKDKSQINNANQIKEMSEDFFKIMTKFFYTHYSTRNRRLLAKKLESYQIISLYKTYQKFHYERH
jgi:Reverse transcriptase (RNA-dependent DNA polymerase)